MVISFTFNSSLDFKLCSIHFLFLCDGERIRVEARKNKHKQTVLIRYGNEIMDTRRHLGGDNYKQYIKSFNALSNSLRATANMEKIYWDIIKQQTQSCHNSLFSIEINLCLILFSFSFFSFWFYVALYNILPICLLIFKYSSMNAINRLVNMQCIHILRAQ